jgi:hypothetical protein
MGQPLGLPADSVTKLGPLPDASVLRVVAGAKHSETQIGAGRRHARLQLYNLLPHPIDALSFSRFVGPSFVSVALRSPMMTMMMTMMAPLLR